MGAKRTSRNLIPYLTWYIASVYVIGVNKGTKREGEGDNYKGWKKGPFVCACNAGWQLQNRRFSGARGGTMPWPDKLPVPQARVTAPWGDSDSSIVNQNTNNETLTGYFDSDYIAQNVTRLPLSRRQTETRRKCSPLALRLGSLLVRSVLLLGQATK